MNVDLFNDMMAGFVEAKKHGAGRKAKLRVSRFAGCPTVCDFFKGWVV